MEIKSKPTIYKGYNFRSRLEARWAVFFDSLGIKYHYEYQDFVLPFEKRYLPDFFLPDFSGGCYAEVKPLFDKDSFSKCLELTLLTHKYTVLLEGVPDYKCVIVIRESEREYEYWNDDYINNRFMRWEVPPDGIIFNRALFCADQAEGENSFFWEPGYEQADLSIPDTYINCLGHSFRNAVNDSRRARFESF